MVAPPKRSSINSLVETTGKRPRLDQPTIEGIVSIYTVTTRLENDFYYTPYPAYLPRQKINNGTKPEASLG